MEKKYEFTEETKVVNDITLHRIKAIRNFGDIKAGDLGGWIEKEENLSQFGDCLVFDEAMVFGDARIFENAKIFGNAWVFGNTRVCKNAQIFENAWVFGDVWVFGNAQIFGNARIYGKATLRKYAFIKSTQDYIALGPIGSRNGFTTFYLRQDHDIWVSCGCFNNSIEEFEKRVKEVHKNTIHAKKYLAAIEYAKQSFSFERNNDT